MKKIAFLIFALFATCFCVDMPYQIPKEHNKYGIELNVEKKEVPIGCVYQINPSNIPENQPFVVSIEKEQQVIFYKEFIRKGSLITEKDKPANQLMDQEFIVPQSREGEPAVISLFGIDGSFCLRHIVVNRPLEAKASDKARIELWLIDVNSNLYMLNGEGFTAGEEIKLQSICSGECNRGVIQADPFGRVTLTLSAGVIGRSGGFGKVVLKRKKERLEIDYPWGSSTTLR